MDTSGFPDTGSANVEAITGYLTVGINAANVGTMSAATGSDEIGGASCGRAVLERRRAWRPE
jgi:hypothetical protein